MLMREYTDRIAVALLELAAALDEEDLALEEIRYRAGPKAPLEQSEVNLPGGQVSGELFGFKMTKTWAA